MQPSSTPYSGVHEDKSLLKFCSEECKGFWFPTPDQRSLFVASNLDEACQVQETVPLLMTAIVRKDNGVEQIYLSVDDTPEDSKNFGRPYVIWHIREFEHQHFAHFYISKDCLPLNFVWTKQYCTSESEVMYNYIATKNLEVQSRIQVLFNRAVKEYGFEDFDAFLKQIKTSKGVSLYHGKLIKRYSIHQKPKANL